MAMRIIEETLVEVEFVAEKAQPWRTVSWIVAETSDFGPATHL